MGEVFIESFGVTPLSSRYLGFCPRGCPVNLVGPDPVVRAARVFPVADGRGEGHGLAIEMELPFSWTEREYNLVAASAGAEVHCGRVYH
jgi:hypothetical protein